MNAPRQIMDCIQPVKVAASFAPNAEVTIAQESTFGKRYATPIWAIYIRKTSKRNW